MAPTASSLLRLVLAPSPKSVTGASLGFPARPPGHDEQLDRVPQAVVAGFETALDSPTMNDLVQRLSLYQEDLTGFAYEGAAMAYTITDAITGKKRLPELLTGPAAPHLFLSYIGVGFALARLPHRLWSRASLDIEAPPYHPTLSWLVVDGYGFDLAYFNADRYVRRQEQPKQHTWLGDSTYFPHAVDQGIGRAIWFIDGADVQRVVETVGTFPKNRRPDLWSGVGLASTFAGPLTQSAASTLRSAAINDGCSSDLATGSVLAAKARHHSGCVPANTKQACSVLTGVDSATAADLADATADERFMPGPTPYDNWRRAIAAELCADTPVPLSA